MPNPMPASKKIPSRQCIERRLSWNRSSTLRRCGAASRGRYGPGAARWCTPRANEAISGACVLPVGDRTAQPCRHRAGNDSVFSNAGKPKNSAQAWQSLLRSGDGTRRARKRRRVRWLVHSVGCRDGHFTRKIPNHALQAVDANCAGGVVGNSIFGTRYLRPLVHPAFASITLERQS